MRIYSVLGCLILIIVFNHIGWAADSQQTVITTNDIRLSLSRIEGTYTWSKDIHRYNYSEKDKIEQILSTKNSDQSVSDLVDCLDDSSTTQSKIDDKYVPLGIICYQALTQLVYYEPTTASGDIDTKWPGYISPKSTLKEMKSAKKAWKKVLKTKTFIYQ